MSTTTVGLFLRHLALSNEVSRLGTATDHDLLAVYESEHGQAAFTELMRRHGPMVLRTCRRILGRGSDAEDAFQATFVLLARQAGQVCREAAGRLTVGGWLHRVAYRTAVNVLTQSTRRKARERQASAMSHSEPDPAIEATWNEVRPIVDAELDALPAEQRQLLIACYLQDKTHAQVAAELGLPLGSVAWRLEKARALLAKRLVRRGVTVSAPLLAVLLAEEMVRGAGVPAVLLVHSVEAAVKFTVPVDGVVSANVARLVKSGLANLAKGSTGFGLACYLGLAVMGMGLLACWAPGAWPDQTSESEPPTARAAQQPRKENDRPTLTDRIGDPLPPGALARLGTVRLRHNAGVESLVFTPDGKGLLTAGGDNLPRLWDAATGRLLREFTSIPKPQVSGNQLFGVSAAVLSPDGRLLAVRSGPMRSLYLLDTATGKRLYEFPCETGYAGNGPFLDFAFSPDSKTIAAQFDGRLELRDTTTGRTLWQKKETAQKRLVTLIFSPDGKTLAGSVGVEGVCLWDAHTGKFLRAVGPQCALNLMAFSPDGRTLAVGCGPGEDREQRNSIHLWDVATGRKVRQLSEPEQRCYYPVFSPDGKTVAARNADGICLWDAATGKELRRCPDTPFCWSPPAFSPDGKVLAALDGLLVRFWDVASGKTQSFQLPAGHESAVNTVAFTPDGRTLISAAGDQTVRWWDPSTGRQQLSLQGSSDLLRLSGGSKDDRIRRACTSALSPDGTMLAVAYVEAPPDKGLSAEQISNGLRAGIRLMDAASGTELRRLDSGNGHADGLAFSPDGKMLAEVFFATKGPSPVVRLWDTASGKRREHVLAGRCPQFSPDGSLLVTLEGIRHAKANAVVHFWEAATGKEVHCLRMNDSIQCLAISPDGKVLATGSDRITLFPLSWAKPSGVHVGTPRLIAYPPHWPVTVLTFSSDGRLLASTSDSDDPIIHLWETASGKERARFQGNGLEATAMSRRVTSITSLSFTAAGRRLASGSADSTILIWDTTGRLQDGRLRPAQLCGQEREKLWADLAADDAAQAGRALWTLAADPKQTVPFVAKHMRTTATNVHAALVKVPQLLRDLDDDAFPVREKAQAELAQLGEAAEPALRQALTKSPSSEMRRRLEQMVKELEGNRDVPSGESLRGLRAVEVLEQIGTAEARQALKTLTASAAVESLLAQAARAALHRLERTEQR